MNITTAWVWSEDDCPELVSAYDELTEDVWNGTPDFFTEDIEKRGGEIRIAVIEVSSSDIYKLFEEPTIQGSISPGGEP